MLIRPYIRKYGGMERQIQEVDDECNPIRDEIDALKEAIEHLIVARKKIVTASVCTNSHEVDEVLTNARDTINLIIDAIMLVENKHSRIKIRTDSLKTRVWTEIPE